jgi:outer membrane protein
MTRKLSIGIGIVMGLMLALSPFWAAQAAGPVKIGIIDVHKIMRDSQAARNARAVLAKDIEAKRAQLIAKDREIKALDEELKNPKIKLSDEIRKQKADKLARDVKDFRRLDADMGEELKKKDAELTQKLLGEIRQIVQSFSKSEKYTLILEKSAVVTSDDAIDITTRIMKIYDAKK